MRLMAAGARNGALVGGRHGKLQQLGERGSPRPDAWPSATPSPPLPDPRSRLATLAEDDAQQLVYFARDFRLDRLGRFFSWADRWDSSTGRNWQTRSLISSS